MRAYDLISESILESLKTLFVNDIQVRIDMDHLINRMAQRGLFDRYREIDAMLRELPDHMSKIADIEPGQQFWLWDPKRKIGLGFRKVNTIPVLMLKTAVSSPPKGERNPVIVTEQLDVKTLSVKELAKKHNVPEKQIIDQLNKGMKVELEHTTDRKVAKEIALDHLKEFPDYYDRLAKAETNESASGYRPAPGVKIDAHREGDTLWINYFEVPAKGKGMGTQEYLRFEKSLPKDIKKIRLVASDAGYGKTHAFWEMMGFDWAYPDDDNEMIKILESASGYIPSNAQKNDPRYKTGLTKDVRPDSIQKNAKAFGFKTSRAGIPPLLRK